MGICAIAIMLLITFFFCAYFQYVQNDSPSSKSLAGLVVQLLHFQEDAFGRRVNNPALTKLPVSIQTLHSTKIAITVESQMGKVFCSYGSSHIFRPSVSWISRQEVLSVTFWDLSTSLRASKAGKLTCVT